MKYWLVLFLILLCVPTVGAQERVKIGFIDIQRAISDSNAGKRAKERFQAQVKKAEAELLKEKTEL